MPQAEVFAPLDELLQLGLVSIWSADLVSQLRASAGSERASVQTNGLGIEHAVDYNGKEGSEEHCAYGRSLNSPARGLRSV